MHARLRRRLLAAAALPFVLFAVPAAARTPPSVAANESIVEGVLTRIVGEPSPASGRAAHEMFVLEGDDAHEYELDVSHATLAEGGIGPLLGHHVRVLARTVPDSGADARRLQVRDARPTLRDAPRTSSLAKAAIANSSGNQAYIALLCYYTDVTPAEPRAPSFFLGEVGSTAPGMAHYFNEASYGALNLSQSTATTAWRSLGHPHSYYFDGIKTDLQALSDIFADCTSAHDAYVNYTGYYGIDIMVNGDLAEEVWGGTKYATLDALTRTWAVTWMPYASNGVGWPTHLYLARAMSYSLGEPLSESPDGWHHGNLWDVGSGSGGFCTIVDATYGCLGQHPIAYGKIAMGLLSAPRIAGYSTGTQTYNIERLAQPPNAPGTYQVVRVSIAGSATRSYTVESRQRVGYDAQLPGDGVLIHEIDTSRADNARLVVPGYSTGSGYGGIAALWLPGMYFLSAADNVRITINSISANGTANVTISPYTAVVDAFPPSCTLPAGWSKPADAAYGWHATTGSAAIGNCSLQSDAMPDPDLGQIVRAQVQYTGTFDAGNVSFWARVSSEAGWDCLRFVMDDLEEDMGPCGGSGGRGLTPSSDIESETGWRFFSFGMAPGTHTLRWSYEKDIDSRGSDAAWIDSVTFPSPAAPPLSADLAIASLVASPASTTTGKDYAFDIVATNNGPGDATGVVVTATVDSGATPVWQSAGCLLHGSWAANPLVTCGVGTLPVGASARVRVVVRRGSATTYSGVTAQVSATTTDPNGTNNSSFTTVQVDAGAPGTPVWRYRLYSPVTLEHHFTTDLNEYNTLGANPAAWQKEGTVGKVLNNPGSYNGVTAIPYYRLYNTTTRWHHWTTDPNEYYTLIQYSNWNAEGVDGWILPAAATGTTQLYRLLYPFVAGLHHWTIDPAEYSSLISTYGWIGEGGSGFVIQ